MLAETGTKNFSSVESSQKRISSRSRIDRRHYFFKLARAFNMPIVYKTKSKFHTAPLHNVVRKSITMSNQTAVGEVIEIVAKKTKSSTVKKKMKNKLEDDYYAFIAYKCLPSDAIHSIQIEEALDYRDSRQLRALFQQKGWGEGRRHVPVMTPDGTTENPYLYYSILGKVKGGWYSTPSGQPIKPDSDYTNVRFNPTLLGGARGKKRTRPTRNRRRRPPMVQAKQEGQINRWTPVDPVVRTVIRYNGLLTSDSSGVLQHRFSLRNPNRAQNGTGNYNGALGFGNLYDEYKVLRFVLQYEPLIAVGSTVTGMMYVAADYDSDDASNQNLSNVSEYGRYKNFDSRRPWEYMTVVPALTAGLTFDGEGQLSASVPIHRGGFLDFASPPVTGCVFVAGDTFPANSNIGRVVATMVILLRRRR